MNALPVSQIDKQWSLFLDRDGVINRRIVDAYVRDPSEFVFLPRVPEAMALLRRTFGYVFLVTNQQGIGKGLMGVDDLERVHAYMESALDYPFDHIYFCPDLASSGSRFRKPETGMAEQARKDFPAVDFSKSVMVGDARSDMLFGEKAGMYTVFLPGTDAAYPQASLQCESLYDFASLIEENV
ncbi:MAG: HAD-IIIA family hydrolase [Bacteroidales bacterium]|nr:HAD-IIIA family hydrolase [Bacteroidales bacterium]